VIPMYPLIGMWGSDVKEKGVVRFTKEYAAMKLTIYLTAGAVIALIGLLWLYTGTGLKTFDIVALEQHLRTAPLASHLQREIFPLLAIGFGVIAPMWPFHSWSPIGHAAAPSAVSMLHAGVLMKLGSYAIIRLAINLLPDGAATWLPWIASLCIMNILYGGFVAMAQKDLKLIIGYSSSSHMGYVLLGLAVLTPLGLDGAVFLMFAHGIMTALAFALVGHVYDETHTRYLPELGGLAAQLPFVASCGVIAAMASSGLPGFANFVAELLVIVGSWDRGPAGGRLLAAAPHSAHRYVGQAICQTDPRHHTDTTCEQHPRTINGTMSTRSGQVAKWPSDRNTTLPLSHLATWPLSR
ncbi:MAG: NADH-quinone oxidoreductase subunit M, partial [Candidatus Omnitrophica bacterium]|nr:NADH-quinone oxidoreductase subunit M [Candidatus Omnitrophota bacterium]